MSDWFEVIGLLSIPVISFILGYIAGRSKRQATKNCGEARVRQSLAKYCKNNDAHVMSNITLQLNDGSTTQIDHVLITNKGIFVIETKHYKGWIFANPKSKVWTQTIYRIKNKFQNPLLQNYKHVKAIQNLLEFLEPRLIYNIVVFSGNAVFKTNKPNNVYYHHELIPAIEQYSDGALSLNRVQFCVGRLEYNRLELTQKTDIEHQAYLTRRFGQ
ncbi:TPA: NERD domain-containing protein [Legionella pneumophila]|nr:NERD domain-containing protein [Legionella pneumophila]HAU1846300.1 NERD domain-containing protein [Legionella pneumophila]